MKQLLFVEVFAGSERLSGAFRAQGWCVDPWDIKAGTQYDVTVKSNLARLLSKLR